MNIPLFHMYQVYLSIFTRIVETVSCSFHKMWNIRNEADKIKRLSQLNKLTVRYVTSVSRFISFFLVI